MSAVFAPDSGLAVTDNGWRQRLRLPLLIAGPTVLGLAALYFYLSGGRYVSTDNAYVRAAQVAISANVAGRVIEVDVHDNQAVRRGDVLFRLDDRPFRIAVEQAQAQLASARLQVEALKAAYRQTLAEQRSAASEQAYRQREFERQQKLVADGIASRAQFDAAQNSLDAAHQRVATAEQQIASALAKLGGNADVKPEQHPAVQQAQADLDKAQLDLSYTVVSAPSDGIVAKVEQLQAGNYINAAAPVFSLISSDDRWIEANFKEDQLAGMRVGQSVGVRIDSFPERRFSGHVASLSPGTGAEFSVLPAENATGNWVKVVQRVPVRIELDPTDVLLGAGLSANVEVDTGAHRSLFGGSVAAPHGALQ
jgi:membrane fusion protein (multidrug efflux system)